jgi:hypothetical protein
LCHIAPGFGSSARRIEGCISGYVTFNAAKADEPKTKQDGAIIFCRDPKDDGWLEIHRLNCLKCTCSPWLILNG